MSAPLIVAFDHASPDGVVEGSLAHSDLDGLAVKEGDSIGIMDSGAGPYEAQVIKVDGDRVVVRAPALSTTRARPGLPAGLNPGGADTLERWWKHWSETTDPSLPESLLLAGREELVDNLLKKLEGGPQVIGVRAGGREEVVAFMAAALSTNVGGLGDRGWGNAFVIKHPDLWEALASGEGRNVLIPLFEGGEYHNAVAAGHCVLVPMSTGDVGRPFIELPRIGRAEGREAFKSIGIEPDRADRYAVRAGRSLVALRRSLAVDPKVARPPWAHGMEGKTLAILVLVGSWSGHLQGDRDIVARVAGQSYGEVERLLQRWELMDDPPFRRSGTLWRTANPEDAWELLKHLVIGEDLERWYQAVLDVLGTFDLLMEEMEADQRAAALLGKEPNASPALRRGLAAGVSILSVTGLPLLAEAAPELFLEAAEQELVGDSSLIGSMATYTLNTPVRFGEHARRFDWGERPEEERRRAVRELWESGGLEAIVGVAEQAECPAYVGLAAALELSDEVLFDLLAWAGSDSGQIQELVGGWVRKKSETDGFLWAEKIAGQIRDLPVEVQVRVFLALRPCSEVWKLLDKQGRSVNDLYWKQIGRISAYGVDPRDISEYVGNLLEHDRPWFAVNALAVALKKDDNGFVGPEGIEMVLNKAIGRGSEQVLGEMDRYYIGRLLDHLEVVKPDSDTLFESELAFCRLFDWGVARTPLAVHRKLAADPEFFARLVYSAHQNEVEDVWSLSVDVAWSILGGWRTLPGIDAIGEDIRSDVLESWIVKARRLLAVYDLTSIGDGYIGELLSGSPIGKDGVWPHESVREVLEELCSQEIEDGMARGLRNSRGVTVRSQYEGGDQERELARKYRQWMRQIDIQWPRTARALRRLAESYEAEAQHHDEYAENLADSD